MRALEGHVPATAQRGLRDAWKSQGLFLACACRPTSDMVVSLPDALGTEVSARVVGREVLSDDVVRLLIEPTEPFDFRAGQFVNIVRPEDHVARPYSIASLPSNGPLEFHVRRIPGGQLSPWLCDDATPGASVALRGPSGECFYLATQDQPLILAGTSTGLAPLLGVVRDALTHGHRGPIALYHGSLHASGLYLRDELNALAATHANVDTCCTVLRGPAPDGVLLEPLEDVLFARHSDTLSGGRAWLCGAPDFVKGLKKRLFLAGMPLRSISSDPFLQAAGK
jgi:NAD(P)H-flavin reductase